MEREKIASSGGNVIRLVRRVNISRPRFNLIQTIRRSRQRTDLVVQHVEGVPVRHSRSNEHHVASSNTSIRSVINSGDNKHLLITDASALHVPHVQTARQDHALADPRRIQFHRHFVHNRRRSSSDKVDFLAHRAVRHATHIGNEVTHRWHYIPPRKNATGIGGSTGAAATAHFKPLASALSAVNTYVSVPTGRRVTVSSAVATMMSPLASTVEAAIFPASSVVKPVTCD